MAPPTRLARKVNRPGWGGGWFYLSEIPSPFQGGFFCCILPVVSTTG
ncbi:MAG: hypothetical protein LV481_05035 [Methylacidiphilales bacterium]|nr:hypothetical protein [Candidatus Methylacidiphilales bacterium]